MYKAILHIELLILYCVSLIMVTITRHIFINISQTEYFSAVKFAMGTNNKNFTFFLWYQNLQKFGKMLKNQTGLLSSSMQETLPLLSSGWFKV